MHSFNLSNFVCIALNIFQFQVQVCKCKKFSGAKESYKTLSTITSLGKNFFIISLNMSSKDVFFCLINFQEDSVGYDIVLKS